MCGEAKVGQFDAEIRIEEEIFNFNVTMYDLIVVAKVNGGHYLLENRSRFTFAQAFLAQYVIWKRTNKWSNRLLKHLASSPSVDLLYNSPFEAYSVTRQMSLLVSIICNKSK